MNKRVNRTRTYMNLWVWQEARNLYVESWRVFKSFPFEMQKVVKNHLASVDSVHRNIAEGYSRKSRKEYLRFLDIALSSLAEATSGHHVYLASKQITEKEFELLDAMAFKIENGLQKLIKSIHEKGNDWNEVIFAKEEAIPYGGENVDFLSHPITSSNE